MVKTGGPSRKSGDKGWEKLLDSPADEKPFDKHATQKVRRRLRTGSGVRVSRLSTNQIGEIRVPITSPSLSQIPPATEQDIANNLEYYADSLPIPDRPDLGFNIWPSLRKRFETYLREVTDDEPIAHYVGGTVTPEEKAILASGYRRYIELEVDPEKLRARFDNTAAFIHSRHADFRITAAEILQRLAHAHLDEGSPYLMPTFQSVRLYLRHSMEWGNIEERMLASAILAHTTPHLPKNVPHLYELAADLRELASQRRSDAAKHCHAYHGLIHCFPPRHHEVALGLAVFGELMAKGGPANLIDAAEDVYDELDYLHASAFGTGRFSLTSVSLASGISLPKTPSTK